MKRILIIDDARDRAAWLKASLELAGFDVVGLLAWEQVDEHSIQAALADVIIVDADAPGHDTLEQIPPNPSSKIPTPRAHSCWSCPLKRCAVQY